MDFKDKIGRGKKTRRDNKTENEENKNYITHEKWKKSDCQCLNMNAFDK